MLTFLLIVGTIGLAIAYVVWSENELSNGGAYRNWWHSDVFVKHALCLPLPETGGGMLQQVEEGVKRGLPARACTGSFSLKLIGKGTLGIKLEKV